MIFFITILDYGLILMKKYYKIRNIQSIENAFYYHLRVFAGRNYAEYLNFACNLPVENKISDLTF